MEGEVFCKVCFKKNFFSKGNYSDGFGKLTPQQEHDKKSGRGSTSISGFQGFSGIKKDEPPKDAPSKVEPPKAAVVAKAEPKEVAAEPPKEKEEPVEEKKEVPKENE